MVDELQGRVRAGVLARQSRAKVKSIEEQVDECVADLEELGATVAGTYTDTVSASPYAKKAREGYPKLLEAIEAGDLDMVTCWLPDRAGRELEEWSRFLKLCGKRGVLIRVKDHGRTYDVNNPHDWRTLADAGIDAQYFSEKLSRAVLRGVRGSARAGRPAAGPCPYGYRRTYSEETGELTGQEINEEQAAIVREIITRLSKSDTVSAITNDLNARGVPSPRGGVWYRDRVKTLAKNVAYIGVRKHKAEGHAAAWAAIVDEATFYAAQRVLSGNVRPLGPNVRPGKQKHLLTYFATCGPCEGEVHARRDGSANTEHYYCPKGCIQIRKDKVDDLIEDLVQRRLRKPDVYKRLRQQWVADDREVLAARGEAARLRERLEEARRAAAAGVISYESLGVSERELQGQIKAAEARERRASVPPALRPFLEPGADVAARWAEATVVAKREVMRYLGLRVELLPAARNAYTFAHERVEADFNG